MVKRNTVAKAGKHVVSFADDGSPRVLNDDGALRQAHPAASVLLTVLETAAFLKVSKSALNKWRGEGSGPRYVRLTGGTVRYRVTDLLAFIDERVRTSTSAA